MGDPISLVSEIEQVIRVTPALLLYVSREGCNVCRELKPKIIKLLIAEFPKMEFRYLDIGSLKEAAGALSVFSVPAILIYFEGKEFFREGRNLGVGQLREKIHRPYSMMFD